MRPVGARTAMGLRCRSRRRRSLTSAGRTRSCGNFINCWEALGPDDPSADDSLATPRESKEQQEKGRFFFFSCLGSGA